MNMPALRSWALVAAVTMAPLAWAWPDDVAAWRAIGIVAGWVGLGLLGGSTLLVLRHPRLARALGGWDTMLRVHHQAGALAFTLLAAHPLALALDAALDAPADGWLLLDPRQQGLAEGLGWLALLALMAGLALALSARLPWRRWHAAHHLLSAAVLLSLLHVDRLLGEPAVLRGLAAVVAAALAWRYLAIDRGRAALPYRVTEVQHPAPGVVEVRLQPEGAVAAVQPGQYVLLAFAEGPAPHVWQGWHGCGEFHPFTVSEVQPRGALRVAIKALGPCTQRLQALPVGTALRLQGPFGQFDPTPGTPQLWVAGGIGITPFMALLRAGPPLAPTTLLYLVRREADAPFVHELRQRAVAAGFDLRVSAGVDAAAQLPALLDAVPDLATREVLACGPAAMTQALRTALHTRGLPPQALRASAFDFR